MRRAVRNPIGLLFKPDELPVSDHGGAGDVTLTMKVLNTHLKAWLLVPEGVPSAKAAWLPFRMAKRGEGAAERQFTMPRHAAHSRGWL